MPDVIVDPAVFLDFCERLAAGRGPVAIDAERASGFRYSQRAYLIQIRREGAGTALIDPMAITDLAPLQAAIGEEEWILHAATQDLPCLAEVGLTPSALFDTELAGRLLGRERVGLAPLVLGELGAVIEKGHGATDWSVRPLTSAQLRYAALDVELLIELRDALDRALVAENKAEIARQEFAALLTFQPRPRTPDEWRRTSGLHKVRKPRALAVVRELWRARDELAVERDVAVGRLLPDASIIVAATSDVRSREELRDLSGFHGRGAHRYLARWWDAIARARALADEDCPGPAPRSDGPPPARAWAERDPLAHARLSAARSGLTDAAERYGMPVENLLTPEVVRRLCWSPPEPADEASVTAVLVSQGARGWQVEACLPVLLAALAITDAPEVTDE